METKRYATPSPERVNVVGKIISGLDKLAEKDEWREVESAQPENLTAYLIEDEDGNKMDCVRDFAGHLACPMEVRTAEGKLIAQSWDGCGWSVDNYIENGVDFEIK